MQDRLSKLVAIFDALDFRANRAGGDDLLGDAYEYLMRHFATESGKSKGQFYTPAEVSRIMAKVVGIGPSTRQDQTIYDPTCGSGSLLLKAADEAHGGLICPGKSGQWFKPLSSAIGVQKGPGTHSPGKRAAADCCKTFRCTRRVRAPPDRTTFQGHDQASSPDVR